MNLIAIMDRDIYKDQPFLVVPGEIVDYIEELDTRSAGEFIKDYLKTAEWTPGKGDRNTAEYRRWRAKVLERDEYTCQICGQVGGRLNVHHIKPFCDYPLLRCDVSNGVTLCERCHKEVHRKHGKK